MVVMLNMTSGTCVKVVFADRLLSVSKLRGSGDSHVRGNCIKKNA